MKNKMLKNSKYLLFFFLFLLSYLFLPQVAADESWSYGFAYNVATGLVPYQDFNMIIPPFFPFLFSIGLCFYKGILMFHIEQALMMTGICYMLERLVPKKYLLLVLLLLVTPCMVYNLPTYNTVCFFFILCLILLEEKNHSDFWIGIILGLMILTKQSIGLVALLVGVYLVYGKKEKFIKRLWGFSIPLFLAGCYFIIAGNFFDFLDQCLFGMVDFSGNGQVFILRPLFCILFFVLFLFWWKRGTYHKKWLYAISFYSICLPLFDLSHFSLGAFSLLVVFLAHSREEFSPHQRLALILFIVMTPCATFLHTYRTGYFPSDILNHEYRYLDYDNYRNLSVLREYSEKHFDQKIVILSTSAYLFKLSSGIPIDKLDLINKGNWGIRGTEKIITEIQKLRGSSTLFLINPEEALDNQIDKDVLNYVIRTGKKVDKVLYFDVYQLK